MDILETQPEPNSRTLKPLLLTPRTSLYQTSSKAWNGCGTGNKATDYETEAAVARTGAETPTTQSSTSMPPQGYSSRGGDPKFLPGATIDADQNGSISSEEWFGYLDANHGRQDAVLRDRPSTPSVPGLFAESRKQLDSQADQRTGIVPIASALASLRPASRSGTRTKTFTEGVNYSGDTPMKQFGQTRMMPQTGLVDFKEVELSTQRPSSRTKMKTQTERVDHRDVGTPHMLGRVQTGSGKSIPLFSQPALPRASKSGKLSTDDDADPVNFTHAYSNYSFDVAFGFRRESSLRKGGVGSVGSSVATTSSLSSSPRTSLRRASAEISVVSALLGR